MQNIEENNPDIPVNYTCLMLRYVTETKNIIIKKQNLICGSNPNELLMCLFLSYQRTLRWIGSTFNFLLFHKFILLQLSLSIMTKILILIVVPQGCTFIGGGVILLALLKKLRDNPKSLKMMSPTSRGIIPVYITILESSRT